MYNQPVHDVPSILGHPVCIRSYSLYSIQESCVSLVLSSTMFSNVPETTSVSRRINRMRGELQNFDCRGTTSIFSLLVLPLDFPLSFAALRPFDSSRTVGRSGSRQREKSVHRWNATQHSLNAPFPEVETRSRAGKGQETTGRGVHHDSCVDFSTLRPSPISMVSTNSSDRRSLSVSSTVDTFGAKISCRSTIFPGFGNPCPGYVPPNDLIESDFYCLSPS